MVLGHAPADVDSRHQLLKREKLEAFLANRARTRQNIERLNLLVAHTTLWHCESRRSQLKDGKTTGLSVLPGCTARSDAGCGGLLRCCA